jgi:adenylate cyclase
MLGHVVRLCRAIGFFRILFYFFITVAVVFSSKFSPQLPLLDRVDKFVYDLTTSIASWSWSSSIDKRVTIVIYDADTLRNMKKKSPFDRELLAKALKQIDEFGPKAIGVDILFDQPQPQDDETLVSVLRGLRAPTSVAYLPSAASAGPTEPHQPLEQAFLEPQEQKFLDSFMARLAGTAARPASVRSAEERGGYVRSWTAPAAGSVPGMAFSVAGSPRDFREYSGPIRFRHPSSKGAYTFNTVAIDSLKTPELAKGVEGHIRGHYVLVGGEVEPLDKHWTPLNATTNTSMYGLEVLGHELVQALDHFQFQELPDWSLWLIIAAAWLVGVATCLSPAALGIPASILTVLYGYDTRPYPATGAMVCWLFGWGLTSAAARAVSSEQRRYAQSALGKYLPVNIATEILKDPKLLNLNGERREIWVIFADLENFTKLSEQVEPEAIARYINGYLSRLSTVVLEHGGTIDKFVGDAVVAFWGAPIARADDADRAILAAVALAEAGEAYRDSILGECPHFGRTRVGLHFGACVVGNFGGVNRIQYTALGDAMNTASRLESANKVLDTRILASWEALERGSSNRFRRMGRISVRGRAAPIDVFDCDPNFPPEAIRRLDAAVTQFLAGDGRALAVIESLCAEFPNDAPLANLAQRLRSTGPGNVFAL